MNSGHVLQSLACGGLLAIAGAASAGAEGTFDIPPGAQFNMEKLAKVGEFFKNEVATGKIPGAIVLIQHHGKPVYHDFFGVSLVRKAYAAANLYDGDFDLAEFAERIAKLPLHDQPGTLWQYGHSTDVLGRIMEIVSGKSLLAVEKDKLLDPIGRKDTGFFITDPAKLKLLAQPMPNDSDFRVGRKYTPETPRKWESATGGMISTMSDFSH